MAGTPTYSSDASTISLTFKLPPSCPRPGIDSLFYPARYAPRATPGAADPKSNVDADETVLEALSGV
jgi:hypothetical protein